MTGKFAKKNIYQENIDDNLIELNRKKDMAKYIGNNIHKYRLDLKLTREQLAEKSNLTSSHIYQLEIGNCVPSIITIIDICNALNISISQLTDNLLFNEVNKFIETVSKDFKELSEKEKNAIIQLIKNLT